MIFRTQNNILFCMLCDMSNSSKPSKTIVFTMVFDDFHYVNELRLLMKNQWNFNEFWIKKRWKNDQKNNEFLYSISILFFDAFFVTFGSCFSSCFPRPGKSWKQLSKGAGFDFFFTTFVYPFAERAKVNFWTPLHGKHSFFCSRGTLKRAKNRCKNKVPQQIP